MQTETFQCESCRKSMVAMDTVREDGVTMCEDCFKHRDTNMDGEPVTRTEYWDSYED